MLRRTRFIRWWSFLVLAAIVCAAFFIATCYVQSRAKSGPFWDRYQQIQFGMTEDEVKQICGPPTIEEYIGGSLGGFCLAWIHDGQTIAVDFDLDGRAIEKRFRAPYLGWVQERPKQVP
jgi:hypothetical protein